MKTFFMPSYLNESYHLHLLKEKNTTSLFNIHFVPFDVFLKKQCLSQPSSKTQFFHFYKQLQSQKDQFPLYGPMFDYIDFCKEIFSFTQDCLLYKIDLSSLPETSKQEKELKQCIQICSSLEHIEKELTQLNLDSFSLEKTMSLPSFFSSFFFYNHHQQALSYQSQQLLFPKAQQFEYRTALNPRQEIEGIAQELIEQKLHAQDINLIVCDNSYFPLIRHVFSRYQIPFGFVQEKKINTCTVQFKAGLNFVLNQDLDSFIHAVDSGFFGSSFSTPTLLYIQRCFSSFSDILNFQPRFSSLSSTSILSSIDIQQLQFQEESFQSFINLLLPKIHSLLKESSAQDLVHLLFNQCASIAQNASQRTELQSLKAELEEFLPLIQSKEDCQLVSQLLQEKISSSESFTNKVVITTIDHPVLPRKVSYLIGAHQKNYPSFPSLSGLFDEHYVSSISLYPSVQQRFDAHMEQLNWIFSSGEKCLFSFPSMDYQGKTLESSLELEELCNSIHPLTCLGNNSFHSSKHQLSPTISSSLFFKDHRLQGSVSSFERYFNCPFSYFLSSGLRLKEPLSTTLGANTMGSLQHALFEELVKANPTTYFEATQEELESLAEPYFETLTTIYPKDYDFLKLVLSRCLVSCMNSLQFLSSMEEATKFKATHLEFRFEKQLDHHPITLRGIIDRIDTCGELLRIIDYKSSSKKLEEKKVKAGLQLQLLTYLLIAKEHLEKEPSGAYYYSLKDESISFDASILDKDEFIPTFPVHSLKEFIKNHRLSGWTFHNTSSLDNGQHILIADYDFDKVQETLNALFDLLVDRIQKGQIEVDPVEGACSFCNFGSICRFKGKGKKTIPLVLVEQSLKKEKEVSSDEMES